ncbi:MAG: hypothetical protein U1E25_12770 [Methylocystis sp.]
MPPGKAIALPARPNRRRLDAGRPCDAASILDPFDGVVAAAIDARHGKVYIAAFGPAGGAALAAPRRRARALRALGSGPLLLIGSGAPLAKEARARGLRSRSPASRPRPTSPSSPAWDSPRSRKPRPLSAISTSLTSRRRARAWRGDGADILHDAADACVAVPAHQA